MSRPAWAYIWGVLLVGGALVAASLPDLLQPAAPWAAWAVFTALATLAQLFKTLFKSKEQSNDGATLYSPMYVFLFAGVLLLPPGFFVLLVAIPHLIEWARERSVKSDLLRQWYIQPFNIANHIIAGAIAAWVYRSFGVGQTVSMSPAPVFGVALAALIYVLLNHLLVGQALVLARGVSWQQSGVLGMETLLSDFVMVSLGYTVALLWELNPWFTAPVLSPLVLIYRALQVPQLKKEAQTDGKTGLLNAHHFNQLYIAEIDRARRFGRPVAFVMADLDLLRNINNTYGHLAGDAVLAGIGRIIRETVREYDIAGRFGGEEFAIVLPEADLPAARALAERLRLAVEAAVFTVGPNAAPISATMSIGVACFPEDAHAPAALTHEADVAVYQAKLQGRNCVVYASDVPHFIKLAQAQPAGVEIGHTQYAAAFSGAPRAELNGATPRPPAQPAPRLTAPAPPPAPVAEAAPPAPRRYSVNFLRLFVGAITVLALGVTVFGFMQGDKLDVIGIGLLLALTAIFEVLQINVYGDNTASVTVATVFAAAVIGGIPGAALAAAAVALTHYVRQRPALYKTGFNWSTHLLAGVAPALIMKLGIPLEIENLLLLALPVLAASLVFFIFDTGLIACAISLASGADLVGTWRKQFQWLAGHYVVLGVIGLFLGIAYTKLGPGGVLVFTLPVLMMRYAQQQYVERTRQSVLELKRMNVELAQANQEVVAASEAIQQLNDELFVTLSKILDARDPYVGGHAEQVSSYAVAIAEELRLSPERIKHVRQAGYLHDIGKIAISEQVLHKPARLTEEEYEYVKTHAAIGAQLLESSLALRHLAPYVRSHHERWDGCGYPDGLAGEEIPLEARILSVCDSVEAMASDRPYSRGKSVSEIITEVKRCAGSHFDPQVAEVFVHIAERERERFVINSAREVVRKHGDSLDAVLLGAGWLVPQVQPPFA
jgi:diguanylate cyclase (GGDEF)-like protein/putative nucleotidyltransferase with HDIG domain